MRGVPLSEIQVSEIRRLAVEGRRTVSQIAREVGANKGSVVYHLRKLGLDSNVARSIGAPKENVSLILNPDLVTLARFFVGTKEFRLRGSSASDVHATGGPRFTLIAIVEPPSRLVALGTCLGSELGARETALVLEASGLRGNGQDVIVSSAKKALAGPFEEACARLGFRLSRPVGWRGGRSYPWAKAIFGAFTNMFQHRLAEMQARMDPAEQIGILEEVVSEWVAYKGLDPRPQLTGDQGVKVYAEHLYIKSDVRNPGDKSMSQITREKERVTGTMTPGSSERRGAPGRVEIRCVVAEQHGRRLIVGTASARDLAILYNSGIAKVDIWEPTNDRGYQRALSATRARRFGRYLGEGKISPTAVLLYQRDSDNAIEVKHDRMTIPIPPDGERAAEPLLYVVDGQHRIFGIAEAYREGWLKDGSEIQIPIVVLVYSPGIDEDPRLEEAMQFLTVNTEQKRVRTDLAHQIVLRSQASTHGKIRATTRIPSGLTRDDQVPYATAVTNLLAESEGSPWHGAIVRPNVPRNTTGMPSQGQFEDALLDNYLGMGSVISWAAGSGMTVGELVQVLSNYWRAVFDLCPDAVAEPEYHVLTKTAGIHALNGLIPALFSARRNLSRVPALREFRETLETMGEVFTDDYWASTGEAAGYGTGKKSFKELAKSIFETLAD